LKLAEEVRPVTSALQAGALESIGPLLVGKGTVKAKVSGPHYAILAMLSSPPSPQKYTELVIGGKVLARGTHVGAGDVWIIFTLQGVTMRQKSSVVQIVSLVP
jgi:hypothetical protein